MGLKLSKALKGQEFKSMVEAIDMDTTFAMANAVYASYADRQGFVEAGGKVKANSALL